VVPCLDEDTVTDLLAGRLRLDAAGVEEHLHACPTCARLIGLCAKDLDGEAGTPAGSAPGSARTSAPTSAPTPTQKSSSTSGLASGTSTTVEKASSSRPRGGYVYELTAGTILNDTYEVLRPIGRGGMGEVYEVRHVRLAGRYAVKVLRNDVSGDEDLLSRFRREAEITSALHHPHIVQVIDFNRTPDGCSFLAMEYMDGCDLAALLRQEGKLPLPRAFRMMSQIVSALTAAHRQGIVHRDLKPANIFVLRDPDDGEERIKLMDFGLSKRSSTRLDASLAFSQDRALIGTPMYMAPEQARGQNREVTPATDQFALAAIFFELLTGTPPFPGDNLAEVLYAIAHERPAALSAQRPELRGVERALERAFAKAQTDRFPSVQSFFRAVENAATEDLARAQQVASSPRRSKKKSLGFSLGAGVLAIAVALIWQTRRGGSTVSVSRANHAIAGDADSALPAPAQAARALPPDDPLARGDGNRQAVKFTPPAAADALAPEQTSTAARGRAGASGRPPARAHVVPFTGPAVRAAPKRPRKLAIENGLPGNREDDGLGAQPNGEARDSAAPSTVPAAADPEAVAPETPAQLVTPHNLIDKL
jgi:serine/threonine protein kinase